MAISQATATAQDRLLRQHADVDAVARGVGRWKNDLLPLLRHHGVDFERWLPGGIRDDGEPQAQSGQAWPKRLLARLSRYDQPEPARAVRRRLPAERWLDAQARESLLRAEHVVGGSREISDVVRAISETTATQVGLRLQRQVAILTWVLAAIGVATLVVVIATAE
jgi:hypothetical protein